MRLKSPVHRKMSEVSFLATYGTFSFFHLVIIGKNMAILEHIVDNCKDFAMKAAAEKVEFVKRFSEHVIPEDIWIYRASAIHLAAKFMPNGLALLLSSLEKNSLLEIENMYQQRPLHVAARNDDSLSTRYIFNLFFKIRMKVK